MTRSKLDGRLNLGRAGAVRGDRLVTGFRFYYGWVILAAGVLGWILSSPGQTYTVSIFLEHLIRDLGISRSLASTLYTGGTLAASLTLPFIGRQIDRRGPRTMIVVIAALLALSCVYMGLVQNAAMLGLGFVLIRMLGQNGMTMTSSNAINHWWVRRRGTVMGIAGVLATLLGSGSVPSLVHWLIAEFGWRASYMLLGLLVAAIMVPAGLFFFRRQPEDYGLLPDGQVADGRLPKVQEGDGQAPTDIAGSLDDTGTPGAVALGANEDNWTRAEAIRAPAFWIISLGTAAISMLMTGLHFHMVSVFDDAGLSAVVAAAVFMPISVTSAIVRLVSGVLVDRVAVRYILCVALIGMAASLVIAPRLAGTASAVIYGIVLGFTNSLQMTVDGVIWAKYFGREHLGSITGVAGLISAAGSALGPMPMGIARDSLGSYTLTLTWLAILPLVLAVVALFARRPQRDE